MRRALLPALLLALAMPAAAQPSPPPEPRPDLVSQPESQEAVSLTVYNGGFGVVREVRPLALRPGANRVRWEGVPAQIDPTSLALKSLTHPEALTVREQNYQYALIGTNSVLDKAVGERIRIRQTAPDGSVTVLEGVLLSQPGQGLVVRLDDGRVLLNPQGQIELAALPEGLLSRPSLLWLLEAQRGGAHRVQASYTTSGLSWKANYVALVSEDETRVDLTGWVTLDNQSGADYRRAQLQLLAGDVRRVQDRPEYARRMDMMAVAEAAADGGFEEESFFEYHLYTLDGETTVLDKETKQMTLLQAPEAGVRRRLVFDNQHPVWWHGSRRPGDTGEFDQKAAVVLTLENAEANGMGMPLPAGVVRVYKADRRGNLQFLGEDRMTHTPRNETVRLYIGDAFDVVGSRKVVQQRQVSRRVREETVEVAVRNRKETATDVTVVERLYGGTAEVLQATPAYERPDASTLEFALRLEPDEEATVRYTVRYTW